MDWRRGKRESEEATRPKALNGAPKRMRLPFTETGITVGGAGFEGRSGSLVFLLTLDVYMASKRKCQGRRQLNVQAGVGVPERGGCRDLTSGIQNQDCLRH